MIQLYNISKVVRYLVSLVFVFCSTVASAAIVNLGDSNVVLNGTTAGDGPEVYGSILDVNDANFSVKFGDAVVTGTVS